MHYLILTLFVVLLSSCVGQGAQFSGPPALEVRFNATEASAELSWQRVYKGDFSHYEVQRFTAGEFAPIATLSTDTDTVFVDRGLYGNTKYRYRVLIYFGKKKNKLTHWASSAVEGRIYRFVNTWKLDKGFLPTRMVLTRGGTLAVVGAGAGRIERFDRAGNPLPSWEFTDEPLACLETSTLDGPVLGLDADDNIYVVYNVLRPGSAPEAFWSKFDRQGQKLWTRPLQGLFARHIAIDGNDRIFIESISQLQQFDTDGTHITQHAVPPLMVASLRFWKNNFAALVEPVEGLGGRWQAPKLVVYSGLQRSAEQRVIGREPLSEDDSGSGLLLRPTDFAIDEDSERVFIINAGRNRIDAFHDRQFLTRWGREGDAPATFRLSGTATVIEALSTSTTAERQVVAGGIARDAEGYLYVADTFNNRIQKFQP